MRILVTGSRHGVDNHLVVHVLRQMPEDATLVHGAANGVDVQCAKAWKAMGRQVEAHKARWPICQGIGCTPEHRKQHPDGREFCPTAGLVRNQKMIDSGVDLLIAFPGGTGTRDCTERAMKAGVRILDAMTGEKK